MVKTQKEYALMKIIINYINLINQQKIHHALKCLCLNLKNTV